jgi:hypothetical protein
MHIKSWSAYNETRTSAKSRMNEAWCTANFLSLFLVCHGLTCMADIQFLKTPPPRVLVDIEALYDFSKAILDRHEKEFGSRTPPTWSGLEYPITRNVSTKYGKRISAYFKEVRVELNCVDCFPKWTHFS